MNNYYEKAFNFFNDNKRLTALCLAVVTLITVMKQFMVTMFIAYFLIIFFLAGILGIIKNEERFKRKSFKRILIFSLAFYDKILRNLIEFAGIYLFNVCLAGGFTVFPLKVWNIFKSDAIAFYSLILLCLIVFVYRLPIFVFSFIDSIIIPKESGKYAIIKIKEIVRKNSKVWLELCSQFFVYILLTFLMIKSKNIISTFFLDELRGIVFLFFMVRNFYWYNDLVKDSGEYKKVYDSDTYSGFYSSVIGRFIM